MELGEVNESIKRFCLWINTEETKVTHNSWTTESRRVVFSDIFILSYIRLRYSRQSQLSQPLQTDMETN